MGGVNWLLYRLNNSFTQYINPTVRLRFQFPVVEVGQAILRYFGPVSRKVYLTSNNLNPDANISSMSAILPSMSAKAVRSAFRRSAADISSARRVSVMLRDPGSETFPRVTSTQRLAL